MERTGSVTWECHWEMRRKVEVGYNQVHAHSWVMNFKEAQFKGGGVD